MISDSRIDPVCTVAYVAGSGRSGSTLLDRTLGSLSTFVSVGELRLLWQEGVIENGTCGCGLPFADCPFWRDVGLKAFGGWDKRLAEEVTRLRGLTTRNRFYPWLFSERLRPRVFVRRLDRYLQVLERLYSAIAEVSGARVVVDSSKDPAYGLVLASSGKLDLRVVHLVRDSRGVVYSWRKRMGSDPRTGRPLLPVYSPLTAAVRWAAFNLLTGLMRRGGTRALKRIAYEDFLAAPEATVSDLVEFLGSGSDVDPAAVVKEASLEFGINHTVSGHPTRLKQGKVRLKLDDEWVTNLGRVHRYAVTILTWPLLVRYGYLRRGVDRSRRS